MTTALVYFIILFCVFYGKNMYIYWYTIKCFKIISNNKDVTHKFIFKKNDVRIKNPRVSFLGVLYFYVIIPPDIPIKFIEDFLNAQFAIINDAFMSLDLTGVVKASRREFIEETSDRKYADNRVYKYVIKFHPVFWYNRPRKFLFFILVYVASWTLIYKYKLYEYATIDNAQILLSYVKDFFTNK